ncbi:hypothetical protein ACIPR8_06945 [Stenotrophomonas sp. LARHCG68]
MKAILDFNAARRGAALVREIAEKRGYCRVTQTQLARTFRASPNLPLRVQASQHVPFAHESVTTGGAA